MSAQVSLAEAGRCPSCDSPLEAGNVYLACPSCGVDLAADLTVIKDAQREDLKRFVNDANDKLVRAGADSAEQSFGLGCLLGGLLVAALVLGLYLAGLFNLITFLVALVIGVLLLTGVATLAASYARTRTIGWTYRKIVTSEIDGYLSDHKLTRQQFRSMADEILAQDAPLRSYLELTPSIQE